jgi:hypothetical protein
MKVFRIILEVVNIKIVMVLRIAKQVRLKRKVAIKVEVGIRLIIKEVQFQLMVLIVIRQRSSCYSCSRLTLRTLKLLML